MMMHDASMKSYYISVGEMNMDWIEVKATCMVHVESSTIQT